MAGRSATLNMADRLLDGGLAETLRRYRDCGVSWPAIVRLLNADHGIEVSVKTLREVWAVELGIEVAA